jgi:hypothetical protein
MAFKPRPIPVTGGTQDTESPLTKAPIRAFVATPAYDGRVITDYALSIAESNLVAPFFGIHVTTTLIKNGAFIDLARNTLVRMFLDSDCTHLFFIDADLRWEARMFINLLKANLPICGAVYPKRQNPEDYPARYATNPVDGGIWVSADGTEDHDKIADNGWIMCERAPTGFLCVRRDVVELMAAKSPKQAIVNGPEQPILFAATHFIRGENNEYLPVDLINGDFTQDDPVDFLGEDFYFCDRYRKMTGKLIPCWPDADFTHGERWDGNWHKFLIKQGEENEAMEKAGLISDAMAQREVDRLGIRNFDLKKITPEQRKMSLDDFAKSLKEAA